MKQQIVKIGSVVAALVTTLVPAQVWAWGPERTTYTMEAPADHVQFNSITNNPVLGDERNFVRVAEAGANGSFIDEVEIVPGKEYEVYIGYHNNAASNLNSSGVGIARGAKVAAQFPTKVTAGQRGTVSAIISAENANPKEVWDEAYLSTQANEVFLRYKEGSAKIYNSWGTNGWVMGTQMFDSTGTYLGLNELDGLLPGCAEYSGHIIYTLVAEGVGATVNKTASLDGQNFSEEVVAKKGDEVTFQVEFKNTGTKDLTNVTFRDQLPEGMSLVKGTTYLYDNAHPDGVQLQDDLIASNGYDTGLYGPGAGARLVYKAKVDDNANCGGLTNTASVNHDNGELSDGATVRVSDAERCCDTNKDGVFEESCTPDHLPSTGPGEIAAAVVVVLGLGTVGVYWISSKKALKKLNNRVK